MFETRLNLDIFNKALSGFECAWVRKLCACVATNAAQTPWSPKEKFSLEINSNVYAIDWKAKTDIFD